MDIVFTFSDNILTIYINNKTCVFDLIELGYNVNVPVSRGETANHLIKNEVVKAIKKCIGIHLSFFQRVFTYKKVSIVSNRQLSNLAAKQYMDLAEFVLNNIVGIRVYIDPNIRNVISENPLYMPDVNSSLFVAERRNSTDAYVNNDISIENSKVTHTS